MRAARASVSFYWPRKKFNSFSYRLSGMKRGRDTLTGGTNDVNPQILTCPTITLAAGADVSDELAINLPISRVGTKGTKVTVFELLKIQFSQPTVQAEPPAATNYLEISYLATGPGTNGAFSNPRVITQDTVNVRIQDSGASFAYAIGTSPWIDLTDGAGHGILIGADVIYFGARHFNLTVTSTWGCKMLYRYKEVGITEYIGMVQQQVGGSGS